MGSYIRISIVEIVYTLSIQHYQCFLFEDLQITIQSYKSYKFNLIMIKTMYFLK